jgi:hypothetical protein
MIALVSTSRAHRLTPSMPPDQVEQLAAVCHAAASAYAWRCLGEQAQPEWCALDDAAREKWMARVVREVGGERPAAARLAVLQLSEMRRHRLITSIVVALTAVA